MFESIYKFFEIYDADVSFVNITAGILVSIIVFQALSGFIIKRFCQNKRKAVILSIVFTVLLVTAFFYSMEILSQRTEDKINQAKIQTHDDIDFLLFWRPAANKKNMPIGGAAFSTDSNSIRSTYEIPIKKEKNEIRILHTGDSWTFGFGLNDDDTYAYNLEKLLQAKYPHKKITSINAGRFGYCLAQSLIFLRHRGYYYKPDIIVVKNNLNSELIEAFSQIYPLPESSLKNRLQKILWNSYFYLYLRRIFFIKTDTFIKSLPQRETQDQKKFCIDLDKIYNYERKAYEAIINDADKNNTRLIFLNLWLQVDENDILGLGVMEEAAKENNIPLIKKELDLSRDPKFHEFTPRHPGPNSSKDIAQEIFNVIEAEKMIE